VPDIYQGSEHCDSSLVDPDNRRPVDFNRSRRLLAAGQTETKLWLIRQLLHHRAAHRDLYEERRYEPLEVRGERADDLVAFRRGHLVVVAPRLGHDLWDATSVSLPPGRWTDVLSQSQADGGSARVGDLLVAFPVAVLVAERA
jgi:(1->4)-alpha-D-glucan 1-alpha-D-glucosylmutase